MGRRPNALILQYFERGPKLQDQSNRYPHTCKACGEHFPRGRIDALTTHLTKRCPAISQEDRLSAFMTLSGMNHAANKIQQRGSQAQGPVQPSGPPADVPMIQGEMERDWTALGVLAEVSRHFDLNEKIDDHTQPANAETLGPDSSVPQTVEHLEAQEQLANDVSVPSNDVAVEKQAELDPQQQQLQQQQQQQQQDPDKALSAEERLQEALRAEDASADPTNLTMAVAATARLPTLLDPQLLGEDVAAAAEVASAGVGPVVTGSLDPVQPGTSEESPSIPTSSVSQPWGEITYTSETYAPGGVGEAVSHQMVNLTKGGFRLETTGLIGAKSRHSRARFDPTRRKQVQEVRKIGACIRCRVLRKTCSKGEPCDTCRKVLSPRVWRSGCVRTKFSEQLDLYSAGVQIVLAQGRVNNIKQSITVGNRGLYIEACHFPDHENALQLQVLQRAGNHAPDGKAGSIAPVDSVTRNPVVMIDNDSQDVPAKVEAYMRKVLPELIKRETSNFMQVTLQTAFDVAGTANDELLKKSLELWGLVELLDRERQWQICVKSGLEDVALHYIKEDDEDQEVFTTICLQLAAAAERKAAATSKSLLTGMQRVLQDSKTKVDFNMYFATLILLNCVEKSTWAFKAWEQDNLRQLWPLEKEPGSFTQQGYVIADLLRMLLGIRKALPRTICREADGKLATEEGDPVIQDYFEAVSLDVAHIKMKQEQPDFSPTDPRSFELLFCSTLLLPGPD
ncbi:hypothetical protein B0H66DRAFT_244883 [Apodospora peruviana]|uniref:Zn(2)-C6 fungal-type domain-containing protein n=1 Tax=Apodospora peruviana TaxID=516989 RepID=A0AAE0I6N4_9PEZI|nr:hypothetical protein B0H66DRAFT_244883 [Apodospora peruviana]